MLEWVLEIEEVFDSTASEKESDANRQSPGKGEMPMFFMQTDLTTPKKKTTFFF